MKPYSISVLISLAVFSPGYSAMGQDVRTLTFDEAMAFERSLQTRPTSATEPPERLFVQPVNKTEPCRLPTTQKQLDRHNFRAYWDGQCKDGFAFGLGRSITVADAHHVEEILVFDGSSEDSSDYSVFYDFTANVMEYSFKNKNTGQYYTFSAVIENEANSFDVFRIYKAYEAESIYVKYHSLFIDVDIYENFSGGVQYRFSMLDLPWVEDGQVSFFVETLDPVTKAPGGAKIIVYRDGTQRHQWQGPDMLENVVLPKDYVLRLLGKAQVDYCLSALTV